MELGRGIEEEREGGEIKRKIEKQREMRKREREAFSCRRGQEDRYGDGNKEEDKNISKENCSTSIERITLSF